ncbi:MAG: zinc-ribbon domain-containing protein [Candidatus Altiarchaeota archaeon]
MLVIRERFYWVTPLLTVAFIFVLLVPTVCAQTIPPVALDMPDVVGLWEPFTVSLVVNDPDIRERAKYLSFSTGANNYVAYLRMDGEVISSIFPYEVSSCTTLPPMKFRVTSDSGLSDIKEVPVKIELFEAGQPPLGYGKHIGWVERNITVVATKATLDYPWKQGLEVKRADPVAMGNIEFSAPAQTVVSTLRNYGTIELSDLSCQAKAKQFDSSTKNKEIWISSSCDPATVKPLTPSVLSVFNSTEGFSCTKHSFSKIDAKQSSSNARFSAIICGELGSMRIGLGETKYVAIGSETAHLAQVRGDWEKALATFKLERKVSPETKHLSSYSLWETTTQGAWTTGTGAWSCSAKPAKEKFTIQGRLTDGHDHPLPYAKVWVKVEGKEYNTVADGRGYYKFEDIAGIDFDAPASQKILLQVTLRYVKDGKEYFSVVDDTVDKYVVLEKRFKPKSETDLEQNIDFNFNNLNPQWDYVRYPRTGVEWASNSKLVRLDDYAATYYYIYDAMDFSQNVLGANIDYKLPVDVWVDGNEKTWYSTGDSYIKIDKADSDFTHGDRPKNTQYHEWGHHLQFSQWNGQWLNGPNDKNHDGFLNDHTGDSFTEGFAEFIAMVMSEYSRNDPHMQLPPEQYGLVGNLENDYKVWEFRGGAEELSVAGVLWDLYDKNNEGNDTVTIGIEQLWPILKERKANFYEYYKAFITTFPGKKEGINKIFIAHGFFADNQTGNSNRDNFEPYRDANKDRQYNAGEYFVDYGVKQSENEIKFDAGETIGKATNYERPNRGKAVEIQNAFIKAPDTRVRYYNVKIDLADGTTQKYMTENRGGLIYLAPLPEDMQATYTLTPKSMDYTSSKPYTITNKEYIEKYYPTPEDQGYIDEHDFGLEETGSNLDPKQEFEGELSWGTDRGYNVQEPVDKIILQDGPIDTSDKIGGDGDDSGGPAGKSSGGLFSSDDSEGSGWLWWLGGGLLVVLLVGGGLLFLIIVLLLWRRRRKKKKEQMKEELPKQKIQSPPKEAPTQTSHSDKKFCTECGANLAGDAQFCTECGAKQL